MAADSELAPNGVSVQDAVALLGIVAILSGELLGGSLDVGLVGDLSGRLASVGLTQDRSGPEHLGPPWRP